METKYAIQEAMELSKVYITKLVSGTDMLTKHVEVVMDNFLDYYSTIKTTLKGKQYKDYEYFEDGMRSEKYHNCYFSQEEVNNITAFLSNLCLKDLMDKDFIVWQDPNVMSQVFNSYYTEFRKAIFSLIAGTFGKDDEFSR